MDWTGVAAIITALAGFYAVHLKNRLQDTTVEGLRNEVATLQRKVDECEKSRARLSKRRSRRPKPSS